MQRKRRSPEERARLAAKFRASGLTQKAFAEREGIKLTALQGCLYRPPRGRRSEVPRFVRVEPGEPAVEMASDGVRLQLGDNVVLHLAAPPDPEFLARLVRALAC